MPKLLNDILFIHLLLSPLYRDQHFENTITVGRDLQNNQPVPS